MYIATHILQVCVRNQLETGERERRRERDMLRCSDDDDLLMSKHGTGTRRVRTLGRVNPEPVC